MGRLPTYSRLACALALVLGGVPASEALAARGPVEVRDGTARFQVITPTLIRIEYAADAAFEDRPTLTVPARGHRPPPYRTSVKDGIRVIRTDEAVLRYRLGSGPFDPSNLRLKLNGFGSVRPGFPAAAPIPSSAPAPTVPAPNPDPDPAPATAGNLGGWYRGLDNQSGPVPLHDGLLSRDGFYVLDDTTSALLVEGGRWYAERPAHAGPYQDGYLFAYGSDYQRALADFRALTGPAPLLPRKAFGNWFSRYQGYSESDYRDLLNDFRANEVPLDVLVVDTDYKYPRDWNGWQWTEVYFENPSRFLNWAHAKGLDVTLNVHPSIPTEDPSFAAADASAGGLIDGGDRCRVFIRDPQATCAVWDWAQRSHVDSYFALHAPFEAAGVDSWWLDYCCDESRAEAAGLTPDTWINSLYAQRARDRGVRWLPLSRIGSSMFNTAGATPGSGPSTATRSTSPATPPPSGRCSTSRPASPPPRAPGSECPTSPTTSAASAAPSWRPISMFAGSRRGWWRRSCACTPIMLRGCPGSTAAAPEQLGELFLRLRESLVPYLYTLARQAYDTGLPLARAMYLGWPKLAAAYRFDRQYMLGDQLLVAPVGTPGDPARKRVWFPPGQWIDLFTGEVHTGARAETLSVPLDRMPIFARAGAVVPRQDYVDSTGTGAYDPLIINVYAGDDGRFTPL